MTSRAKTYGKRKALDFTSGFENLSISPAKNTARVALSPKSRNVGRVNTQRNKKDEGNQPETRKSPKTKCAKAKRVLDEHAAKSLKSEYSKWEKSLVISKIAQGSYGSVLRMQSKDDPQQYRIYKLLPLKPRHGKGSRQQGQTFIDDARTEVRALETMTESPGFVEFQSACFLKGSLPQQLCKIYETWEKSLPAREREEAWTRTDYPEEQLWLLIEMTDAGSDLENLLSKGFSNGKWLNKKRHGKRLGIRQTWDIFWGVAEALAHGEVHAQFEHRDLHPGNVCIKKAGITPVDPAETSKPIIPKYTDLTITLIDYTLSRLTCANGETLANTMSDKAMFEQTSEVEVDQMQYATYRYMRDLVEGKDSGTRGNHAAEWEDFVSTTNVLWLSHLLAIMLRETETPPKKARSPVVAALNSSREAVDRLEDAELLSCLTQWKTMLNAEKMDDWRVSSAKELVQYQAEGEDAFWQYAHKESTKQDGNCIGHTHSETKKGSLAHVNKGLKDISSNMIK